MLSPAICDRARLARDRRFDGRFFTGVLTTRIYCRPVCPVRPARSGRVRFFPSAAAAELAGFRPCLRCRPEAAPGSAAWSGTAATVSRGLALINRGFLDENGLTDLAETLGMGARHLTRLFVQHCGAPPGAVARTRRVQIAKRLLDETTMTMTDVALVAGFGSLRRFNSVFRTTYRRSPSEIRRKPGAAAGRDDGIALRLYYRPPYDWLGMLRRLAMDALPGIECVTGHEYRRTIELDGHPGWLAVRPAEGEPALQVALHLAEPSALKTAIDRLHTMLDLGADPASIASGLASLLRDGRSRGKLSSLRLPGAWDGFEVAVRTVVDEGSDASATPKALHSLVERFGRLASTPPTAGLNRLFPSADTLSRAPLRGCGLHATVAATIRTLALAVTSGRVAFEPDMPYPSLVEALVTQAGLSGPAAKWIAMRTLGEPDADVARWLNVAGRVPDTLRPWRSYAALHLAAARVKTRAS